MAIPHSTSPRDSSDNTHESYIGPSLATSHASQNHLSFGQHHSSMTGPLVQGWHLTSESSNGSAPKPAFTSTSDAFLFRSLDGARIRTQHACEKCRARKAKCSGEHPTCKRCRDRGLLCEYSKEPRVRGPSKARLDNASRPRSTESSAGDKSSQKAWEGRRKSLPHDASTPSFILKHHAQKYSMDNPIPIPPGMYGSTANSMSQLSTYNDTWQQDRRMSWEPSSYSYTPVAQPRRLSMNPHYHHPYGSSSSPTENSVHYPDHGHFDPAFNFPSASSYDSADSAQMKLPTLITSVRQPYEQNPMKWPTPPLDSEPSSATSSSFSHDLSSIPHRTSPTDGEHAQQGYRYMQWPEPTGDRKASPEHGVALAHPSPIALPDCNTFWSHDQEGPSTDRSWSHVQ